MKIADLLSEASDIIPEYVFEQERLRDELKKNSEVLKQQILDQDIFIQELKKKIEKQDQIIHKLKNPPCEEKKKTWWSYKRRDDL
jgi:hypothetical protein